jgi:histidinol-phosphatase (PHP family)
MFESHCHTPLCRHAVGEPEEYVQNALERGLKGIHVTCHGPTPREWSHCMKRHEWPEYLAIVERARDKFAGQIEVFTGVECDFMPSLVDYWREFLSKNEFSHILGSVHPQVADYRREFWRGDALDYQKTYFKHLAAAAETRLFDTLSHPDLVKNTTPDEWDLERILPHIERQLDRIAATGVAMELNTSGLNKTISEMNPAPQILRAMSQRQIPVVIGADAHVPERVGDRFEEALDLIAECGFQNVSYFHNRQRVDVPIETAKASLKKATPAP